MGMFTYGLWRHIPYTSERGLKILAYSLQLSKELYGFRDGSCWLTVTGFWLLVIGHCLWSVPGWILKFGSFLDFRFLFLGSLRLQDAGFQLPVFSFQFSSGMLMVENWSFLFLWFFGSCLLVLFQFPVFSLVALLNSEAYSSDRDGQTDMQDHLPTALWKQAWSYWLKACSLKLAAYSFAKDRTKWFPIINNK